MAYNAGDVESKLELDRSPFITGLKESLAEAESWKAKANKALKATADINQAPFNRALSAMQAKLTKTFAKTYTAKVRIDDKGQLPKITEINNRLNLLAKKVIKPQVKVDVDEGSLKSLDGTLSRIGRDRTITIKTNIDDVIKDALKLEPILDKLGRDRDVRIDFTFNAAALARIQELLDIITQDRKVYIDIEMRQFIADYMRITGMLDALEANKRTIRVQLDVDITRGMGQLFVAEQMINFIDNRSINIDMDVDNSMFIQKITDVTKTLDKGSQGLSRYWQRMLLLGTAITLLVAPALGTFSTLLATIPVVSAGAALSLATLSMGFEGFATAVSNPVTASEIERQKAALESLSPVARQVADYFNGPFKAAFANLKNTVQDKLFEGVLDQLKRVQSILPAVRQGLVDNAGAWNKILIGILGVVTSSEGLKQTIAIIDGLNRSLVGLTPMFTIATGTFMDLAAVGTQTLPFLVTELNKFAAGFDAMVQNAIKTGVLAEAFRQLAAVTGALLYAFTQLMGAGFQAMVDTGPNLSAFIIAFTDALVALMPILSDLSNIFMNIMTPALRALTPLFVQLQPVFDALSGTSSALGPFITALGYAIGDLLIVVVPVVTWLIKFATAILELMGPLAGPIMGAFVGFIAAMRLLAIVINIARIATTFFSLALWANPITWVVIGIVALIAAIVLLVMNWDKVTAAMGVAWEWLKGVFAKGWEAIKNTLSGLLNWLADLPNKMVYFAGYILGVIIRFGIDLYNGFMNSMAQLVEFFVTLPDRIRTWLGNATVWLMTTGKDTITGFFTGLINAAVDIWIWLQALPDNFTRYVANAGAWLVTTGYNLIQGLKEGLLNAWGSFVTWIAGLFASFIDGIKAGLGISSPSTIMMEIGTFLIQGLINGITAAWNAVTTFFANVWAGIKLQVEIGFAAVTNAFNTALTFISNLWTTVWNSVSTFFSDVWNGIRLQATILWSAIQAFFSAALNVFVAFWSSIWNGILNFFVNLWNGIKAQAIALWNGIYLFYTTALNIWSTFWSTLWNGILNFFITLWNNIKTWAMNLWNTLYSWYQIALNIWLAFWQNLWNSILTFFTNLWNSLVTTAQTIWNTLRAWWDTALNAFSEFWAGLWEGIKSTFERIFSGIVDIAKRIWQTVKDVFRTSINAVIGGVNWPIDKINGLFGINIPRIPEIGPFALGGYWDMPGAPVKNAPIGPVRGAGGPKDDRILARLSNKEHVWSAAEVRAAGGHKAVANMRAAVLHSGLSQPTAAKSSHPAKMSSLNLGNTGLAGKRRMAQMRKPNMDDKGRVLLAFGGVKPHVAEAGFEIERVFGRMPGGIGGVGARSGPSDHPSGHALDFMTLSNMPLGDRVAGHLQANKPRMGVKYLIWKQAINEGGGWSPMENRGSVTANHFDHVHASFVGGHEGGPGFFSVDYGAIFDALAGPFKPLGESFLRGLIPVPPVPQWIEDWGVGAYNKGWDGLRKKAIELMQTVVGWLGGGGGAGGAEQWRPAVLAALARTGQPASMADITLARMNKESGGNPRAINNWDSNARRGTPSKGLMQVIDPTFAAHRDPGLPNDIWDPMANITAAIRYALSRYGGSLPAAFNRAGGYDTGGTLMPGWTMAYNGTGKNEHVLTHEQMTGLIDYPRAAAENDMVVVKSDNKELIATMKEIKELLKSRGNIIVNDASGNPQETARQALLQMRLG